MSCSRNRFGSRQFWIPAGVLIILPLLGAFYQWSGARSDAKRFPEAGRLVDVGGLKLMLNCTGRGSPTVVLDAGLGELAGQWQAVQDELRGRMRVCSYDRAGYGRSDAGPAPRTSLKIANELHALLKTAGEQPPFILVGHSFAGFTLRVYNGLFPNEVLGLVLLDATHEDQYMLLPKAWQRIGAQEKKYRRQAVWAPLFVTFGLGRLLFHTHLLPGFQHLGKSAYLLLRPDYFRARASELQYIRASAEQARSTTGLGAKPLVVISAAKDSGEAIRTLTPKELVEFQKTWVTVVQARLTQLSNRCKWMILSDAGHDIPRERPDAVVTAVEAVRREISSGGLTQ